MAEEFEQYFNLNLLNNTLNKLNFVGYDSCAFYLFYIPVLSALDLKKLEIY